MSARSKKQPKQKHLRNRKLRELARRQQRKANTAGNTVTSDKPFVEQLRFDEPEPDPDEDFYELGRGDEPLDDGVDVDADVDEMCQAEREPPEQRDDDSLDIWWDEFSAADGPARLQMTRQKLETVSADDDIFQHLFPEAVYELESKLGGWTAPLLGVKVHRSRFAQVV